MEIVSRVAYRMSIGLLVGLSLASAVWAQAPDEIKKGVVRVSARMEGKRKEGTGFIVHLEQNAAYIVTASHVIEGDLEPHVTFYVEPNRPRPSKVIGIESNDPKGVAMLRVETDLPDGLLVLNLDPSVRVSGGEAVTLVGFPRLSGTSWAVTQGTVAGQRGGELTFTAAADEGNSGGPLIKDGKAIGVITEVAGQFGYAAPAVTVRFALQGWDAPLGEARPESLDKQGEPGYEAGQLLRMAKLQSGNRDFDGAWSLIEDALKVQQSPEGLQAQTELAMAWLRNNAANQGAKATAVVDKVLPAVFRGAAGTDRALAADSLAHIGYGNYLKRREGALSLEVDENYQKSVKLDPENTYAHAMWGHWIRVGQRGSLEEARNHFSIALKSGRDRKFVRRLQLSALQGDDAESVVEIVRALDEMRKNEETLERREKERLASHVYFMCRREVLEQLSSILPASEHLATYEWLLRDTRREDLGRDFWWGRLAEAAGDCEKALSHYRAIHARFSDFVLGQELNDGIKRCEAKVRNAR